MKKITYAKAVTDEDKVERLASELDLPRELAFMLVRRGVDEKNARDFLNPEYSRISDPMKMNDMNVATERIWRGIENDEKICVYADYDADGIPGAVIMDRFFKRIGYGNHFVYIPHRHKEGYGISESSLELLKDEGVGLMITVDLGIGAVEEINRAMLYSIDVIITDHHEPPEKLPNALAIVNPKLGDYPDTMLCGAATAWQVVRALIKTAPEKYRGKIGDSFDKWLLDLAGLATLSDMVPLVNENRIIASLGMRVLRNTRRPGLLELINASGLSPESITETDLVFSVTPKINTASRMGDPVDAFKLLSAETSAVALKYLSVLVRDDKKRKDSVKSILRSASKKIEALEEIPAVIVVGDREWNHGVVGIVASGLADKYNRPAFVWSASDSEIAKGSCRSDGVCNVLELLRGADEHLVGYGGHEGAGGFSLKISELHLLDKKLNETYEELYGKKKSEGVTVEYEFELSASQVNKDFYNIVRKMAPFGEGNPEPLILVKDAKVANAKSFGKRGEHLEIVLGSGLKCVKFFHGASEIKAGDKVNIIGNISVDNWGYKKTGNIKFIIRDII